MVKRLSQTNRQAPTKRQIHAYEAAQNQKFEIKIKGLRQLLKAQKAGLEELREKKSMLVGEIKLNAEAITQMDSKTLSSEALGIKLKGTKNSLSASNAELRSLERKSIDIVSKIKQVEKELETLGNKFFKKQQRENCELLLSDLRNQKSQIDSQKLSQVNLRQAHVLLKLNLEKQINLHLKILKNNKAFQNLQSKIKTKENSLVTSEQALKDLTAEFKRAKSLDDSSLKSKAAKFVVQQHKKSEQVRLIQQSKIKEKKRDIQKLELFLTENRLPHLEKQLRIVNSAVEKLENKCNSLEGLISRWIKNKVATNEFFRREHKNSSPGQVLEELKRENRLHVYLPLSNMDSKHLESKKVLVKKRATALFIENRIKEVKQATIQLTKLKKNLAVLEKFEAKLSSGSKGHLPKMAIENWSDAELFAEKYMKWLGFADAKRTGAGADEGKDVDSRKAIAQVKDMGTGASRPMLQQLNGVAAAERKIPIFFARSYATTAKEWGEKHGIALFQFSLRGEVKAISRKARELKEGS